MQAQFDTRSFDEILNAPVTELEELESIYCEMHKDVYGVKARWYRAESVEQARADIERLGAELEQVQAEEEFAQEQAIARFLELVVEHHKGDFEAAVRGQHDAFGTQGDDEFLEYNLGIPYKWIARHRKELADLAAADWADVGCEFDAKVA